MLRHFQQTEEMVKSAGAASYPVPASPSEYRGPLLTVVSRLPRLVRVGCSGTASRYDVVTRQGFANGLPRHSTACLRPSPRPQGSRRGRLPSQCQNMPSIARVMPHAIAPLGLRHARVIYRSRFLSTLSDEGSTGNFTVGGQSTFEPPSEVGFQ